jgi:hypothetical protein
VQTPTARGPHPVSSPRTHFVLDSCRDHILNCGNYGMGWCASRVPAHFILAAQGSAKRPTRRQLHFPNVQSLPPGRRLDAVRKDPKRVEAGINRLLLPCPARLRPAEPGSNRWTPQSIGDDPPGPRLRARWPWTRSEVEARDAQACVRNESSERGIAELCASCRRRKSRLRHPRPAGRTFFRGRGPACGCRFRIRRRCRGDVLQSHDKRIASKRMLKPQMNADVSR